MEGAPMRPWVIVLSGAIGAIIVAAAMAVLEVVNAPRAEIAPLLLSRAPALVVGALAAYGLIAIVMTAAALVAEILRIRRYLVQTAAAQGSTQSEGGVVFVNGLRRLAPRLAATVIQSGTAHRGLAFDARLTAREIRGEIARLYYISLARSHFLSALIVLAGIAALGLAHDRASLPLQSSTIPTASAVMIIAGLILLGILGRVATDVTAEPLLEAIPQPLAERVEVGLLRRAVELLEFLHSRPPVAETMPVPPAQIPERLVASIEQMHHALLDAVNHLSASTGALEAAMRTSVETIETTLRTVAAQLRPAENDKFAGPTGFSELQTAVEELTAVLQRLSAMPEGAEEAALAGDRVSRSRTASVPRLARELHQLLQEIEAAR
jgi:hypothetical protein